MNKIILIGNLTKDPELTQTSNGISVCKFTLAVSRKYQNADGEKETDFINCVAWRNLADTIEKFVKKGSKIGVIGSMQTRSYEAQDGTKRYVTEVVADEIEFLSTKDKAESEKPKTEQTTMSVIPDDDLPF